MSNKTPPTKIQLLELRKTIKKAQPIFLRTQYGALKKLAKKWRKPSGIHNKLRHHIFGKRVSVEVGYRSPAAVRGLDRNGLLPIRIHQPSDVAHLNPSLHSAIIANVGLKNKLAILAELQTKGIRVLNYKHVEESVKKMKERHANLITEAKKRKQTRVSAAKEREVVKPKQKETPKTEQEKKKELDKVLTQTSE